jgi:nucleoside phosphorylase
MATKHTRIKRSIDELKNFLEYYSDEYKDTYSDIIPNHGWQIEYYEEELYSLLNNIYGNLFDSLYPKLFEENPSTDEEILNEIKSIEKYLSDSEELFKKIIDKSEEKVLSIAEGIVYDLVSKAKFKLKEVISLAENDLKNFRTASSGLKEDISNGDYIIGIITATITEHNAVLKLLKDYNLSLYDEMDSNTYYEGYFEKGNKKIKVVLTKTHHQGIPAAVATTTKLIIKYHPKVIFMVGHQAGNRNLKGTHKIGHILIGEESIDYQQNEVIQRKGNELIIEEKDRKRSVNINSWLKTQLELYFQKQEVLDQIKENYFYKANFPDQLMGHIGKIVSGSALLRAAERFNEILSQNPGTIGLDMETHGFYYACENTVTQNQPMFASVKSISDYGEQGANYDDLIKSPLTRQDYACYTSANFIYEFIMFTF